MTMKADTTVKWFSSDLEGAPELRGQLGEMIALLSTCLVDGFGARTPDTLVVSDGVATAHFAAEAPYRKYSVVRISGASEPLLNAEWRLSYQQGGEVRFDCPGVPDGGVVGAGFAFASAGWARPFAAPAQHKAVFQSQNLAGTQCYLRVEDGQTIHAKVRAYETMTDVDAGERPFPTSLESGTVLPAWMKSSPLVVSGRPWILAADDRFLVLAVNFSEEPVDVYRGYSVYAFGDLSESAQSDAFHCILCAHRPGAVQFPAVGLGLAEMPADGGLTLARDLAGTTYSPSASASALPGGFIQEADGLLRYYPDRVYQGGRQRGRVPGLYVAEARKRPLRTQITEVGDTALYEFEVGAFYYGYEGHQGAMQIVGPWR